MALAPTRNRTITITPESQLYRANQPVVQLDTSKNFVDKFLPTKGLGGFLSNKIIDRSVVLAGVTNINGVNRSDVADEAGLFTSFIQPWFIKNVPIQLKGQSYIGAYPALSVSDRDFERILKIYKNSLSDFTELQGKAGTKEKFLLEFRGYPEGMRRYLGYITECSWNESIKTVNVLDYTIGFIGRNVDNAAIISGKTGAQDAQSTASGTSHG